MKTKEKIYIGAIVILVILLIVTNLEIQKAPERKPRTEEHIKDSEIWKVCDYRESLLGCTTTECPKVYDCWEIQKNCKSQVNSTDLLQENKTNDTENTGWTFIIESKIIESKNTTEKDYDLNFEQIPVGETYCLSFVNYSQYCDWYKDSGKYFQSCYSCANHFEKCYNKTGFDVDNLISDRITTVLC